MTACFYIGHARSTCWVFVVAKQFGIRLCPFLFGLMCFFVMLMWILFVWLVWAPCLGFGSFSNHCFRKLLVFFFLVFSGSSELYFILGFSGFSELYIYIFLSLIYILTFYQKNKINNSSSPWTKHAKIS